MTIENAADSELQNQTYIELEELWRLGFEAMGYDPDTSSVEYMLPAAREVIFADE